MSERRGWRRYSAAVVFLAACAAGLGAGLAWMPAQVNDARAGTPSAATLHRDAAIAGGGGSGGCAGCGDKSTMAAFAKQPHQAADGHSGVPAGGGSETRP
jgi:hypothetical protein